MEEVVEKVSIGGKIIGTTADKVEYSKESWLQNSNIKTALDNLHNRLKVVEQQGGGGSDDDIVNVNGTWVSFGDSITALNDDRGIQQNQYVTKGYQDRVMAKIHFSAFHNYAWTGYTSSQYKTEIDNMVNDGIVPDYVTWLFGTNDLFNGGGGWLGTLQDYINKTASSGLPQKYTSAIRFFVDRILEINPNAKIILGTIPKRGGGSVADYIPHWWVQYNNVYQAQYADVVLQIANYDSRISGVVDYFNLPLSNDSTLYHESNPATGFLYDGTHPSDLGMQAMADMLIAVFKKII